MSCHYCHWNSIRTNISIWRQAPLNDHALVGCIRMTGIIVQFFSFVYICYHFRCFSLSLWEDIPFILILLLQMTKSKIFHFMHSQLEWNGVRMSNYSDVRSFYSANENIEKLCVFSFEINSRRNSFVVVVVVVKLYNLCREITRNC